MTNPIRQKITNIVVILLAFSLPLSLLAVNVFLAVSLLLVIWRWIEDKSAFKETFTGATIPILVYLTLLTVSILLTKYEMRFADFFEDKWVIACYLPAFLLVRDEETLKKVIIAQIIAGTIAALYATFQFFFGYDFLDSRHLEEIASGYMAVSVFTHHLTYGGVSLIVFIIALAQLLFNPHLRRVIYIIAAVLMGFGLFASYARSAVLGLCGALFVIVLTAEKKIRRILILASIAGLIIAVVALPGFTGRFTNIFSSGESDESPRIRLWQSSVEIIKDHPILGIGPDNFGIVFPEYKIPGRYHSVCHPHCDGLSAAIDGGLLSLAAFLSIWAVFFIKSARNLKTANDDRFIKSSIISGMSIAAGILIAGLFQNYLTDAEVANLVWFNVGLGLAAANLKLPATVDS